VESPNARYIPAVDHLRLYAAGMVLVYHGFTRFDTKLTPWPHPQHWPELLVTEGYAGVSLFMVLSGFILTYAALGKHVSYGPFLRNRALRLLPLLVVLFVVAASMSPSSMSPQLFWITLVPTHTADSSVFGVAWSVFVEIELYLMFPVLLRHLDSGGPRRLLAVLALLAGFRFAALSSGANPYSLLYFSVFARADQFILGMIAAWALRRYRTRLWGLLAPAGTLLVLLMLDSFSRNGGVRLANGSGLGARWAVLSPTVEGLGFACVVLGYVALMQGAGGALSKALAQLGATSYSIYLLHMVVITALVDNHVRLDLGPTPFLRSVATGVLVALPLTLLASRLSYTLIELPFLRRRTRWIDEPPRVAPVALKVEAAS